MNSTSSKPIILITGTHGFVGARAMDFYRNAVPVPGELLRNAGESLMAFVDNHHPDIIINTAAISDIGTCENHPDDSYAANVTLPVVLAKAARKTGAKLISFSSDQVYTGCTEDGPYRENFVLPEPANVYARHKLEAEQRVMDIAPDSVLLRATWMYDMPLYRGYGPKGSAAAAAPHANRGNFLVNTLNAVLHGNELCFSSLQYRGITYVRQVVSFLDQASQLPGGAYNYGSENSLNMLETVQALLQELDLSASVKDTKQIRRNLWMDCGKLRSLGIHFDTTAEGFARCAADYGLRQTP